MTGSNDFAQTDINRAMHIIWPIKRLSSLDHIHIDDQSNLAAGIAYKWKLSLWNICSQNCCRTLNEWHQFDKNTLIQ